MGNECASPWAVFCHFGTWLPPLSSYLQKDILSVFTMAPLSPYYSERSWNSKILNIIFKKVNIQIYLTNVQSPNNRYMKTHSFWWCSSWSRMHSRHLQTVSLYQCVISNWLGLLSETPWIPSPFSYLHWVYSKSGSTLLVGFHLNFLFWNNQVRDRIGSNSVYLLFWWIMRVMGI